MHVAFYIISLMNIFFKMKGPTIINLKIFWKKKGNSIDKNNYIDFNCSSLL